MARRIIYVIKVDAITERLNNAIRVFVHMCCKGQWRLKKSVKLSPYV